MIRPGCSERTCWPIAFSARHGPVAFDFLEEETGVRADPAMVSKRRQPVTWADDLFSLDPGSFVPHDLSRLS
jgi:hypothetical protein